MTNDKNADLVLYLVKDIFKPKVNAYMSYSLNRLPNLFSHLTVFTKGQLIIKNLIKPRGCLLHLLPRRAAKEYMCTRYYMLV